jgi:hypothetical protein
MAQASWSAPTRMVFLLHGEDSFRTRLRVGELVSSLLASGAGEPRDLSERESPRLIRFRDRISGRTSHSDRPC